MLAKALGPPLVDRREHPQAPGHDQREERDAPQKIGKTSG